MSRLEQQIQFIVEIDKLKNVIRRTNLVDDSRLENSVEHSWHAALMAFLLVEYASDPNLNPAHVAKMILVHDLVEIDAGDTFCYDQAAGLDQREREIKAAERIFNILPPDQAREIRALWDEFEAGQTAEAKFAATLDRLQPVLLNYHSGGGSWRKHSITHAQVLKRNSRIAEGSPALWEYALGLINDAQARGALG